MSNNNTQINWIGIMAVLLCCAGILWYTSSQVDALPVAAPIQRQVAPVISQSVIAATQDDTPITIEAGKDGNPDKAVLTLPDNQKVVIHLTAFSKESDPKFVLINQFDAGGTFVIGSNMSCSKVDPAQGYIGSLSDDITLWKLLPKSYQTKIIETCQKVEVL